MPPSQIPLHHPWLASGFYFDVDTEWLLGLLGGTALILFISGLNGLKDGSSSTRKGPLQVVYRFKRLLGKTSKLTFTGVMGGLYLSSALLGFYIFFTDSARMIHPQAFASSSFVLACVTLTAC